MSLNPIQAWIFQAFEFLSFSKFHNLRCSKNSNVATIDGWCYWIFHPYFLSNNEGSGYSYGTRTPTYIRYSYESLLRMIITGSITLGKSYLVFNSVITFQLSNNDIDAVHRAPVDQLVEHRAVTREVVSSTPAGPTLRVFK